MYVLKLIINNTYCTVWIIIVGIGENKTNGSLWCACGRIMVHCTASLHFCFRRLCTSAWKLTCITTRNELTTRKSMVTVPGRLPATTQLDNFFFFCLSLHCYYCICVHVISNLLAYIHNPVRWRLRRIPYVSVCLFLSDKVAFSFQT